ncbi:flavin reductase (DIM6/NTAB) family NADH-FMN oxidoreductase RutF [Paraburkholderia sp. WSM4177]|nr:flavin reductase (DIM6/NTAB) family NADH-FMN oxidoreductase RutF [Paraburkholderia sp. WSM4177]MBB5483321.1 flavin reductase (DIM6/NTAB) family NADH-FMN oxidoreductase RutF [Paraburkholderia sp. WSM4180]
MSSQPVQVDAGIDENRQQFRQAMAHLGAAVNVITTAAPHGCCDITASAVCSVTDTPPTLLICLNR